MAQVLALTKGDARVIRLMVRRLDGDACDLTGYQLGTLSLYEDEYSTGSPPVIFWSTNVPGQGTFVDPINGQVEFYVLSSQSSLLSKKQYFVQCQLTKDVEHLYTVYKGFVEIR